MKFDFQQFAGGERQEAPTKTSNWFKPLNGDNRIRIMSGGADYFNHFSKTGGYIGVCIGLNNNCPACTALEGEKVKVQDPKNLELLTNILSPNKYYLFWVIDRKDNQLKLYRMSEGVYNQLKDWQNDKEYAFTDVPMPYDVNIKTDTKASPKDYYKVIPGRQLVPVTEAEMTEFNNQTETSMIVQKIKDKKIKELNGQPVTTGLKVPGTNEPYPKDIGEPDFGPHGN